MRTENWVKVLSTAGVVIFVFSGSAIARRAGFGNENWLMSAFALGVMLTSQAPLIFLRSKLSALEGKLALLEQQSKR